MWETTFHSAFKYNIIRIIVTYHNHNSRISITTVYIHMQTTQYKYTGGLRCSGTNHLLTSEFGSLTRGERQFLKVFRNHTMLTTPQHSAHLVVWTQFLNTRVRTQLPSSRVHSQLPTAWLDSNFTPSWSDPNFNCLPLRQTIKLSVYMVQSQLPTASFSKSSNSQDHCFQAWRHLLSSSFPIWGLLWQLWLSYLLRASVNCTQCLCTWTKSRIVQNPIKLNDKIQLTKND